MESSESAKENRQGSGGRRELQENVHFLKRPVYFWSIPWPTPPLSNIMSVKYKVLEK